MKKISLIALLLIACTVCGVLVACSSSKYNEEIAGTYYAFLYDSKEGEYTKSKDNYFQLESNGMCNYNLPYMMNNGAISTEEAYKCIGATRFRYNGQSIKLNILSYQTYKVDNVMRVGDTYFCKENDLPYEVGDNVKYARYDNDTYRVYGLADKSVSDINISTYNGKAVTEIVSNACAGSSLENVIIESELLRIGNNAFKDCTELKSITIPSSITMIADCAFMGCGKFDLIYQGKLTEWEAINMTDTWIGYRGYSECTVHCEDGDLHYEINR